MRDQSYPPPASLVQTTDLNYRDDAAALLYTEAGGSSIVRAHAKIARALEKQGEKLEEHFNTPYTENSADVLEASTRALVVLEGQIERWHHLIYPNQNGRA